MGQTYGLQAEVCPCLAALKGKAMIKFAVCAACFVIFTFELTATSYSQSFNSKKPLVVIDQALTAVGSGSAEVVKKRLFTEQITVVDAEARRRAIEALPGSLQRQRITQGKLFRRIESALTQALQLHDRLAHGQVELFLYHDALPMAQLWRGGVLMISD